MQAYLIMTKFSRNRIVLWCTWCTYPPPPLFLCFCGCRGYVCCKHIHCYAFISFLQLHCLTENPQRGLLGKIQLNLKLLQLVCICSILHIWNLTVQFLFLHAVTKHREISAGDEASKDQADTKTGWQRSLLPTVLLKICMIYRFFPLYLYFLPTIILKICMIYRFFPYFLLP